MKRFWPTLSLLMLAWPSRDACAGVLLVPDSAGDRIFAFSPFDGSLVNDNFIPDDGRLDLPKNAIDSGRGSILISDQVNDSVFEYAYNGEFMRTVAGPADGLHNLRGIAVRGDWVYVTIGANAGAITDTVQQCRLDGSGCSTFLGTNLAGPFDIFFRSNDVLISSSGSNSIQQFDLDGTLIGSWAGEYSFPEQIHADGSTSDLLIAGFAGFSGVYRVRANGIQLGSGPYVGANSHPRSGYRLENGTILVTNSTSVTVFNPSASSSMVVATGGDFQYIEYSPAPEPATLALLSLGIMVVRHRLQNLVRPGNILLFSPQSETAR